jgi:hypothetical protein
MKSPFPGMDPYLELHWGDVHTSLITYSRDQLRPKLPGDLRARVEERIFVEIPGVSERSIYPDVHIVEVERPGNGGAATGGGLAVAEPIVVTPTLDEPVTERYLEIIDVSSGGRVVTVIEFLSRANKRPGDSRTLYLQKMEELRRGGVNTVEIDLLRGGARTFALQEPYLPVPVRRGYAACVRRGTLIPRYELYPFPLLERLPAIRIPLRETDEDVPLDLQALVDLCYENGGYDTIDYRTELDPPLSHDERRPVESLLRERIEH